MNLIESEISVQENEEITYMNLKASFDADIGSPYNY